MKVTSPADRKGVIEHMRSTFTVDVDVSTADLIAELEKRRPCNADNCKQDCTKCVWGPISHLKGRTDNFKEAK